MLFKKNVFLKTDFVLTNRPDPDEVPHNAEVSQVNVLNSVKIMLEACNHISDDLVQFVLFILNMANHE